MSVKITSCYFKVLQNTWCGYRYFNLSLGSCFVCYGNAPTSLWISMSPLCIKHLEVDTTMCLDRHSLWTVQSPDWEEKFSAHRQKWPFSCSTGHGWIMPGPAGDTLLNVQCGKGGSLWDGPFTITVQQLVSSFLLVHFLIEFIFLCLSSLSFSPTPTPVFNSYFFAPVLGITISI